MVTHWDENNSPSENPVVNKKNDGSNAGNSQFSLVYTKRTLRSVLPSLSSGFSLQEKHVNFCGESPVQEKHVNFSSGFYIIIRIFHLRALK